MNKRFLALVVAIGLTPFGALAQSDEMLPAWTGPLTPTSGGGGASAGGTITASTAPFAAYYSAATVIDGTATLQFPAAGAVFNEAGSATIDLRVECDHEANCIFVDSSADDIIFNDGGTGTFDFRVEGDTDANLLVVAGSLDCVGIGTLTCGALLNVVRNQNAVTRLVIENNTAGVAAQSGIQVTSDANAWGFFAHSSTYNNGPGAAQPDTVELRGGSAVEAWITTDNNAGIVFGSGDTTVSNELFRVDGTAVAGTGEVVVNEQSYNDVDFRIEGATEAALFFADGSADDIIMNDGGASTFNLRVETDTFTDAFEIDSSPTERAYVRVPLSVGINTIAIGTAAANVGGVIHNDVTPVGNVNAGEDDLMSFSVVGATLNIDKQAMRWRAWGTTAANVNAKNIKCYFGATVLVTTGALSFNGASWEAEGVVLRTAAATQTANATTATSSALLPITVLTTTPAETLSGAVTMKCTGEGVATNDIVQNGYEIEWLPVGAF